MSRILKISQSDYRIKVQSGGTITLDTGATGSVVVIGNLDLVGTITAIDTVNTTIKDNVVVLNNGETSSLGIGNGTGSSGLKIDRGPVLPAAELLFDESVIHYDPKLGHDVNGTFVVETASSMSGNYLSGLQYNAILTGDSDFVFDLRNSYNSVVRLTNIVPIDYANILLGNNDIAHDNAIVNKKFVTEFFRLSASNGSRIFKSDIDNNVKSEVITTDTAVNVNINGTLNAKVTATGLYVNNINLYNNTITNIADTLVLSSATDKPVNINSVLSLTNQSTSPVDTISGVTRIFPLSSVGAGGTGVYVKNTTMQDELVAKKRSLLFSMLF